jgi:hypothetical protein
MNAHIDESDSQPEHHYTDSICERPITAPGEWGRPVAWRPSLVGSSTSEGTATEHNS